MVFDGITVDRVLYLVGSFHRIGGRPIAPGRPVSVSLASGGRSNCFDTNGSIQVTSADGQGGYFIAGNFTSVTDASGSHARNGLVRITASCGVDSSFQPPPNLPGVPGQTYAVRGITALAINDGRLYVGGDLRITPPPPHAPDDVPGIVIAINPSSGARDQTFPALELPASVRAPSSMVPQSTGLRVATRNALLSVSPAGAGQLLEPMPTSVRRLWRAGGLLFEARFVNNVTQELRALTLDGTPAPGWSPVTFSSMGVTSVEDVAAEGPRAFIVGNFDRVAGVQRSGVVALNLASGQVDGAWVPPSFRKTIDNPQSSVNRLVVDGQRLLLAGEFGMAGEVARTGFAALNLATAQLESWEPASTEGFVPHLMRFGSDAVAVGLKAFGGARRHGGASIDLDTGAILNWDPGLPSTASPRAVVRTGAVAWIVGGGVGLAQVPLTDAAHTPFYAPVAFEGGGGPVIATTGSAVFVGGTFSGVATSGGTFARSRVAAFDASTGQLLPWAPPEFLETRYVGGASVDALHVTGPAVVVGGTFTTVGGAARTSFAALSVADATLLPADLALGGAGMVYRFAADSSRLYAAVRSGAGGPALRAVSLAGLVPAPFLAMSVSGFSGFAYLAGRLYTDNWEVDATTGAALRTIGAVGGPLVSSSDGLYSLRSSDGVSFFPLVQSLPPAAPGNLVPSTTGNFVTLSWTAPAGDGAEPASALAGLATSYVIRAGSQAGLVNLADFDTGGLATGFQATAPNGTYYVRVHSRNAFGLSPPSNEVIFTLGLCGTPPTPPTGLGAGVSGSTVSLTWGPASGATTYVVEAGSRAGQSDLAEVNVGSDLLFSATAAPGVYFVRVRGTNACGHGPASNEVQVTVGSGMTLPGVPQGFTQSVDSSRTVSLAWAIPTTGGAPEGYVIEAGSAPGLADLAVISVPGLVFIAPNVAPGTYYVRVRAVNGAGRGPATLDAMVVVR